MSSVIIQSLRVKLEGSVKVVQALCGHHRKVNIFIMRILNLKRNMLPPFTIFYIKCKSWLNSKHGITETDFEGNMFVKHPHLNYNLLQILIGWGDNLINVQ